jgi:hypothetical protein
VILLNVFSKRIHSIGARLDPALSLLLVWTIGFAIDLAGDLNSLGEHDAARQLSEDTLARARRVLGDESHFTIETANNLADARQSLKEREPSPQYDYHSTDGSHWVKNGSSLFSVGYSA